MKKHLKSEYLKHLHQLERALLIRQIIDVVAAACPLKIDRIVLPLDALEAMGFPTTFGGLPERRCFGSIENPLAQFWLEDHDVVFLLDLRGSESELLATASQVSEAAPVAWSVFLEASIGMS